MTKYYGSSVGVMYRTLCPDNVDDSHVTLMYLGLTDNATYTFEELKEAVSSANFEDIGEVPIVGPEFFGPNEDIPVFLLEKTIKLSLARAKLSLALSKIGAFNASEFDFSPHITVDSHDIEAPDSVFIGTPEVWWGDIHAAS